jgi:hypothetical protein
VAADNASKHTRYVDTSRVAFQLATSSNEPAADGLLNKVKHDRRRIAAFADGKEGLRLLSRNGLDRTSRRRLRRRGRAPPPALSV